MAITFEARQDLLTVIVGMFDGAPTKSLLESLAARVEAGDTVAELAVELGETAELATIYPTYLTANEFSEMFVGNLLGDNVTAATKALAVEFVEGLINGGSSRGEAMYTAIQALSSVPEDDATWGAAVTQLNNKVEVATYFAITQNPANATLEDLRSVTANVDTTDESVSLQKLLVDAGLNSVIQELTVGEDDLVGSGANDVFEAEIFDNQNKLQSGDSIDGKGGNDTLIAEIGNSNQNVITLKSTSLENVFFQAQATANDDNASDNETGNATIDAQFMNGTTAFWSNLSRADLVIEDIQNNSHLTTIGFRSSDQGDVDYEVYFDNITAPDGTTAGSQLFLEVLDLEAAAATGDKLTNNPYVGVSITVDGVQYDIVGDSAITTTYQDLVDALNAALDAAGLTTVTASLGEEFKKFNSDDGLQYSGTQIVLTNTGAETLEGLGWVVNGTVPADTNVHTAINDAAPSTTTELTQTNVIFDDVGQGSQGGDFLAGNMSTGSSGSNGIQQFNITVQNDSWVDTVRTTNNDLEKVVIVNDSSASTDGDLRLGDVSGGYGLNDVQTLDATAMTGDLNVKASLGMQVEKTETLKDKYYDLKDTQTGAENDNVTFSYQTGAGADKVDLTISEEAVAYEDLVLEVSTGAGDDYVQFEVANKTTDLNTNWDEDQAALDNITISTGAGNDTVWAKGDGEVTISTGAGNDVIYTDNSGNKATWLFNGTDVQNDILGQGASTKHFLYNAKVTVTFSSGSADANGGVTVADAAANDNGFESTVSLNLSDYVADNLDIVQAIKQAIESDATLSKLLTVEDGPNGSLLVTSLVDGVFQADDLDVTITQGTLPATTASDFSAVQDAWEAFKSNSNSANVTSTDLANELSALQGQGVGFNGTSQLAPSTVLSLGNTETTAFAAGTNEVQTFGIAGDSAADGQTLIFTIDGQAFTFTAAGGNGADNDTIGAALTGAGGIFENAVTVNNRTYTVTYDAGTDALTFTQAGTGKDIADITLGGTGNINNGAGVATTTAGVDATAEVNTVDVSATSLAAGETIEFTIDGSAYSYTNTTGGALTGDALEAAIAANMTVTNYTVANAGGTGDLTFTQNDGYEKAIADITAEINSSTGSNSTENAADNTINVGTGDDVLVLSTNANSNETIVFTGTNLGNVDIFNFEDTVTTGLDILDFTAMLTTKQYATGSTSEVSQTRVATSLNADGTAEANSVTVIDFTAGTGNDAAETFAALTAADLLNALNDTATTANYGSITEAALDAQAATTTQVGDSRDYIVMVHNEANDGEYKVFHLTSSDAAQTGTTNGDFATAELVGTVDLGEDAAFTVANFA